MEFPADAGHGFALRDGVLAARSAAKARGGDESTDSDGPRLPPLRLGASYADSRAALASPCSSSSSDAFLSTSSSPSGTGRDTGKFHSPTNAPNPPSARACVRVVCNELATDAVNLDLHETHSSTLYTTCFWSSF
jgi:hypothetical protein